MKFMIQILSTCLLTMSILSVQAQKQVVEKSNTQTQDSLIQATLQKFPANTQFAVAALNNTTVRLIGYKNNETAVTAINNSTAVFEIGSITKTFTATLFAKCIEQKLLQHTTTLQQVFGFTIEDSTVANITLQQLANHTSGLPRLPTNFKMGNAANPYVDYDTTMLYRYLKKAVTQTKPGTTYAYSNLGAGLLGVISAKALKTSYDDALKQYIFNPLSMNNSSAILTTEQENLLVKGLDANGEETDNWNFDCLAGGGAILSTISDMALYAKAQLNEQPTIFNYCHTPTFKNNERMSMGLGWHLIKSNDGNTILFHNGATGGYVSSMMVDKANKKAVVILTNVSAFNAKMNLIDMLCNQLLRKL